MLPGTSTVREYLTFHARLRMPAGTLPSAVAARVAAVESQLSLLKVADSFIGDAFVRGLSGGEKRRVSIAVELLTRPGVLLLDEPTTGLDSTNAARVVDIMAALARQGVTVVMSIHQPRPDIFRLMDRILIMSSDGQVVFSGPTHLATAHFAALGHVASSPSVSIADQVLDLVIKVRDSFPVLARPQRLARLSCAAGSSTPARLTFASIDSLPHLGRSQAPQSTVNQLLAAWARSDIGRQDGAWVERLVLDDARAAATSPEVRLSAILAARVREGARLTLRRLRAVALAAQAPLALAVRKYEASYSQQLSALAARLSSNLVRHPLLITLNFAFTFVIALGIGAVYWDSGTDTGGIQVRRSSNLRSLVARGATGPTRATTWLSLDDRRTASARCSSSFSTSRSWASARCPSGPTTGCSS